MIWEYNQREGQGIRGLDVSSLGKDTTRQIVVY